MIRDRQNCYNVMYLNGMAYWLNCYAEKLC